MMDESGTVVLPHNTGEHGEDEQARQPEGGELGDEPPAVENDGTGGEDPLC